MENSEDIREREAALLRKWFASQNKFGSWGAMERALNITKDYLHSVKDGKRRAIDPELRNKLFKATGLKIFGTKAVRSTGSIIIEHGQKKRETVLDTSSRANSIAVFTEQKTVQAVPVSSLKDEVSVKATKIKKLLIALTDELEFFKQKPESVRKTFREIISGQDVGYITTLLRALYDEDQFQRWLLFSEYKLKSKEEE